MASSSEKEVSEDEVPFRQRQGEDGDKSFRLSPFLNDAVTKCKTTNKKGEGSSFGCDAI